MSPGYVSGRRNRFYGSVRGPNRLLRALFYVEDTVAGEQLLTVVQTVFRRPVARLSLGSGLTSRVPDLIMEAA